MEPTEILKELLICNPHIDENAVLNGICLTNKLKKSMVTNNLLEPKIPYSGPKVHVIGSASQRYAIHLGPR